ncbi:hypothetical protein FSP39_015523 [Pinctada imbricata]|uniref:Guanylate cyclase n=1 Tax=Pinctada imbricata TaxID=66713 RepID=A0AA88Y9J0_PINIB|nr:hypothetical protein FSP39_015523 [Pinctada imbricata]
MFSQRNFDILIAEVDFKYASTLGLFASEYSTPLILPNNILPYKQSHHVLSLTSGFQLTSLAVVEYLEWFQWAEVAIISTQDTYWQQMVPVLESTMFQHQFSVKRSFTITDMTSSSAVLTILDQIPSSTKAVILLMETTDARQLMTSTVTWNSDHSHELFLVAKSPYFNFNELTEGIQNISSLKEIFRYLFVIVPNVPTLTGNHVFNPSYDFQTRDAFYSVCQGLNLTYNVSADFLEVNRFIDNLHAATFRADNRTVAFTDDNERVFDYVLYHFETVSNSFESTLLVQRDINSNTWSRNVISDIRSVIAPDSCFKGANCETNAGLNVVLVIAISLGVVALTGGIALVGIIIWRKRAKINLTKGPNKILLEMDDLTFLQKKGAKSVKQIANGTLLDKPDLVKASEKSNRSLASLHELSEFSQYARYKGDVVYVKEIKVKGFEVSGKLLTYIRTLREIRHENVNPIYGFLIDPLRSALVTEYCNRGSLMDVINNNNIKLDWDFKVSLLTDLVRGLRFIQGSQIHYHGNLTSRNCVIDSRWVLKLTDFGMPGFRERGKMTASYEPSELLWTAPEHLRDPFPGMRGSEKGDMYSLAIIMQEIILRKQPFGMIDLKPKEIISKIRNPPPLLRPSVSPQAAQPQYIQLMKECWSENPELRPAIEEIYQQFKHIAGGKKMNIVDSMFRMLEKYSNDLEDIVKERTLQLEEEKMKTDILLYRMLPATVAESLKLGKTVEAVSYSEVTIYFSDIVGFTTISAMSTPMQVVSLLNDLYTMFDATIDNYDVYKVETIGDAYMVVSGLPVPNTRNAGEIGTMALDLLSQCGTFTIRHMPEVPMRLRIGLHTGPCVAGVVGLTMPRYCLFGDTVNTASRMESTGSAFRVHVSSETKGKLDEIGGYITEYRGQVELKGKGLKDTYWLTMKDGFKKPLPTPPPLTDLDTVFCMQKDADSISGPSSPVSGNVSKTEVANPDSKSINSSPTKRTNDLKAEQNQSSQGQEHSHKKVSSVSVKSVETVESTVSSSDVTIITKLDQNIDGIGNTLSPVHEV